MERALLLGLVSLRSARPLSRTERSQLQPEMEAQVEPTKFWVVAQFESNITAPSRSLPPEITAPFKSE